MPQITIKTPGDVLLVQNFLAIPSDVEVLDLLTTPKNISNLGNGYVWVPLEEPVQIGDLTVIAQTSWMTRVSDGETDGRKFHGLKSATDGILFSLYGEKIQYRIFDRFRFVRVYTASPLSDNLLDAIVQDTELATAVDRKPHRIHTGYTLALVGRGYSGLRKQLEELMTEQFFIENVNVAPF